MTHINLEEITSVNELANALTEANIRSLQNILSIPPIILEVTGNKPIDFLNVLKYEINEFHPSQFIKALEKIERPDLIPLTKKIAWLGSAEVKQGTRNFESFVTLLRAGVTTTQWKVILGSVLSERVASDINFETAFKMCIEGGLIKPDLEILCNVMVAVGRHDIAENIKKYSNVFQEMTKDEFQNKLMDELDSDDNEAQGNWSSKLRAYTKLQNKKVSIMLDEEENVLLENVYTSLTVVKEEFMNIKVGEDIYLNEIEFLKSMSDNRKKHETVDFVTLVSVQDPNEPEVLILIGNPGSGKTFLCKYIALLYGIYELNNFTCVVSVPCRNEEWHKMEKTREENEIKIEEGFVQKWLSLAMPMGTMWSKSLAKHITKTGGEGILLIIDGADEFIKDVPFKSTLLYFLLQKRILNLATVLLTSRPGAWNELQEEYGQELRVDSNFQVLGFSPSDRDSYFEKRISTEDKLNDTKTLFFRHDEINQLSLVPVNASLFTSLFNATKNILSQTLTHLYTELIVYIIRRQLSRMGLKRLTRVECMAQFHPPILQCIGCIGEEAYEGIFHKELSCREEDISIRVDSSDHKTERLGLMQVQVKVLKLGKRVNVWTFAHLTLQEYMSALYLSNKKWVMQCVMIRFIVSSEEVFAMYKMVVRFLCGLLTDKAACIVKIICRHLIPDTMSLSGLPIMHQLYYFMNLIEVSDWIMFTEIYLIICSIIVETNSRLMKSYFSCLSSFLPDHLYFYFRNSILPNEWHCFMQSLNYICQMEILFIQTSQINPIQFKSLLHQLCSCSLMYLALAFDQDYHTIQSYTSLLVSVDIAVNYMISISLLQCELTESQPCSPLFPTTNTKWFGSIKLSKSVISHGILTDITKQFSYIENFYYEPKSDDSDWSILLPLLTNNSRIKGLHIRDPSSFLPVTPDILSGLSSLEVLYWYKQDSYTALPFLQTHSLSYLRLLSPQQPPLGENSKQQLIELINNNRTILREIGLECVHTVRLNSWTSILTPIQSCHHLVSLSLYNSPFTSDDISYWDTAILCLQSLVELCLIRIPLQDAGLMTLCKCLNTHPAIRLLRIADACKLTSNSCEPIMMLIHTLPYLRLLELFMPELSLPDANPLQLLQQTAELFSVEVEFDYRSY